MLVLERLIKELHQKAIQQYEHKDTLIICKCNHACISLKHYKCLHRSNFKISFGICMISKIINKQWMIWSTAYTHAVSCRRQSN